MHSKSPPKLARKDLPYKNRIPPAHEVSLCLELACFHILCCKLCVFGSILCPNHQEPGYLLPAVTELYPFSKEHLKIKTWMLNLTNVHYKIGDIFSDWRKELVSEDQKVGI